MSYITNIQKQENAQEIERFVVFRFPTRLGKGIKNRLKSLGCSWNPLFQGWICPLFKEKEVQHAIDAAKVKCSIQIVSLPKGSIPTDPKIASSEAKIEILEKNYYNVDTQLLQDVYSYDPSLRPYDFSEPSNEEGKSPERIRIEVDFHNRWQDLQKLKADLENARDEFSHLKSDSEKVFDPKAPLLIADALIQSHFLFNDIRTLQYCSDAFWEWDGVKYVELSETAMRQKIYHFLRDAKRLSDGGALAHFNPDKYKVNLVIDALKAVCHQKYHPASGSVWLDVRKEPKPKQLIAFQNGFLNVEGWLSGYSDLIPHTPLLLNVNALDFEFKPNAFEPQEWLSFVNSIWPDDVESQQALQEWVGYLLTQDTSLHKILLIVGPPRSGKGTIGRVLHELLGTFNVAGPTLSSLEGEFGLQPLLNKMLATISDARLNGRGNSVIIERLLSISGEDPLTINRKYLPPLTVQLSTRLIIMTNELPNMQDASGALAKRYLVLTLQKSWYDKEDSTLFGRLRKELPGILLWALQGLKRLQERGRFLQPSSSSQTIAELEAMTSPIKAFISERCEIKAYLRIPISLLFNAWREWCGISGYLQTGNVQSFGKNLRAAYPEIDICRTQDGSYRERYYKGIALLPQLSTDVRGHKEFDY